MPRPCLGFSLADTERLIAAVAQVDGHPPVTWFDPFCRGLAEGLVLRAIQSEVYCGRVQGRESDVHQLRSSIDRSSRFVRLPRGARVLVRCGRTLEAAQPWARMLPQPFNERPLSSPSQLPLRWARLRHAFESPDTLCELACLWFHHQVIRLPSRPDLVMVPANLVAHVVKQLRPSELWWDTAPALPYYDWEIQAAVLPAMPLHRWNRSNLEMPGDVATNASIANLLPSEQIIGSNKHPQSHPSAQVQPLRYGNPAQRAPAQCKALVHDHCELTLAIAG